MTQLEMLLADGIIDEVLGQLKSGKEAEVWLVSHGGETVAAKIYKERDFRSFKNNAEYKEGRQVRNTRTQRAMDKGSKFGQQAAEEAWKAAEATALSQLHAAGVRVPKPVLFYEGVLLMEVVVDAEGHVAPRLVDAQIPREAAAGLYQAVRGQAVKMLCADLIHGDLSEFNVLLAHDGPMLIDLPQVISAAQNSRAEHFFKRDVENLRRFFSLVDPAIAERRSDGDEIWRAYVRRELTHDFEPTGKLNVPAAGQGGRSNAQPGRRNERNRRRGKGETQGPPPAKPQSGPQVSYRGAPPPPPAIPQHPQSQRQPQQRAQQPSQQRAQQQSQQRAPQQSQQRATQQSQQRAPQQSQHRPAQQSQQQPAQQSPQNPQQRRSQNSAPQPGRGQHPQAPRPSQPDRPAGPSGQGHRRRSRHRSR